MLRITLDGVVHVLKSMTLPISLRHLSSACIKSGHPLQRVAINIVGPTPRSSSGNECLLVVSDHFSKFAQVFPVRNTSAVTLAKKVMDEYIYQFWVLWEFTLWSGSQCGGSCLQGTVPNVWQGSYFDCGCSPEAWNVAFPRRRYRLTPIMLFSRRNNWRRRSR